MHASPFVDVGQLEGYEPANHSHTVNRRLVDTSLGARRLELLLGSGSGSGGAHVHWHPGIEQVCYVLHGTALTSVAGQTMAMTPGCACYFPSGRSHSLRAADGASIQALVAYSPPYLENTAVGIAGHDPDSDSGRPGGIVPWPKPLFGVAGPAQACVAAGYPGCSVAALVDGPSMGAQGLELLELRIPSGTTTHLPAIDRERALYMLSGDALLQVGEHSGKLRPDMSCFVPTGCDVHLSVGDRDARLLAFVAG